MIAYLGLGSNLGDRVTLLVRAVDLLDCCDSISVQDVSRVYETEPVGGPSQDAFLNAAVKVATTLDAHELLERCRCIENELGRVRSEQWGPRTIDIDILLYGSGVIRTDRLTVPHPRMAERAFVLRPLMDIAPDVVHPVSGESIRMLYDHIGAVGVRDFDGKVPGWRR